MASQHRLWGTLGLGRKELKTGPAGRPRAAAAPPDGGADTWGELDQEREEMGVVAPSVCDLPPPSDPEPGGPLALSAAEHL